MIKTLRASGSAIQADVVVGQNEYGSDVTVAVRLSRRDHEVQELLAPLTDHLTRQALGVMTTAVQEQVIRAKVTERLRAAVESQRKRIAANLRKEWEDRLATKDRELSAALMEQRRLNAKNTELIERLNGLQKEIAQ